MFIDYYGVFSKKNNLIYNDVNVSFNMINNLSCILKKNSDLNYNYFSKNNINDIAKKILLKEVVLLYEIKKFELKISKHNIMNFIFNISYFKNDGVFSTNLYKSVLNKNNISEKDFFFFINKELLISQIEDSIKLSSFIIDEEFLLYIDNVYQIRDCLSIVYNKFFLFNDFFISDLDIDFYKNKISIIPQIDISCIDLSIDNFIIDINYDNYKIKNHYDKFINYYTYPECVNVKSFVIYYNENYSINMEYIKKIYNDLRNLILNSENLVNFSSDYFLLCNNGNVGWMYKKGDILNNFLERSIFKLNKGDFSDLLLTDYGLYIIQLLDKLGTFNKSYDVVYYDVLNDYKRVFFETHLLEISESVSDLIFDNFNIKSIAEQISLKERETYLFVVNKYNMINCYNDVFNLSFNDDIVLLKNFTNLIKINSGYYIIINVNKYWASSFQKKYEYFYKLKYYVFFMKRLSIINCINRYLFKYLDLGIVPYFFFKKYETSFYMYKNIFMNSNLSKYLINNLFSIFLSQYKIWISKNILFFDKNIKLISLTNIISGFNRFNNLYDFLKTRNIYFKNYTDFESLLYKDYLLLKSNVKI